MLRATIRQESVADYEKMLEGLYTRLEAKDKECRELREQNTKNREQIGRLTTSLDSLRREHDSLVSSADNLSEQIISRKREQVHDTIQVQPACLVAARASTVPDPDCLSPGHCIGDSRCGAGLCVFVSVCGSECSCTWRSSPARSTSIGLWNCRRSWCVCAAATHQNCFCSIGLAAAVRLRF